MEDKELQRVAATQLQHATKLQGRIAGVIDYRRLGWLQLELGLLACGFTALFLDMSSQSEPFPTVLLVPPILIASNLWQGKLNLLHIVPRQPQRISNTLIYVLLMGFFLISLISIFWSDFYPAWLSIGFPFLVLGLLSGSALRTMQKAKHTAIPKNIPAEPLSPRYGWFTINIGIMLALTCSATVLQNDDSVFRNKLATALGTLVIINCLIYLCTGTLLRLGARWAQIHWTVFYCALASVGLLQVLAVHTDLINRTLCIFVGILVFIAFCVTSFSRKKKN